MQTNTKRIIQIVILLSLLGLLYYQYQNSQSNLHTPPVTFKTVQRKWKDIAKEAQQITSKSKKVRRRDQWISDSAMKDLETLVGKNDSWVQTWTDSGDWMEYPLMYDNEFVREEKTKIQCPITCKVLSELTRSGLHVKIAGFSRLQKEKHIAPHTDDTDPEHPSQPYHLGLTGHGLLHIRDKKGSPEGSVLHQLPGQDFVIDTVFAHSVLNVGAEDRIILYINYVK